MRDLLLPVRKVADGRSLRLSRIFVKKSGCLVVRYWFREISFLTWPTTFMKTSEYCEDIIVLC